MKSHSIQFKNNLKQLGRELRGVITYNETTLEEEIYTITPHYEADLLKSVMKQLDLELSVDIPLNTIINCQIGIKVDNEYEMLNFGNYVVYSSEKQEDMNTYKIICYDKMLYSMKKNESLGIEYPIKIKDYLNAVANKIGLTVKDTTFYNQDMTIPSELYLGLEYTYRDILDEIAQATGSIICLNENDEIIVKYPTITNDTIDEEFLKDVNVKFGEKYGAINTIVLSRSGESDNVYYPSPVPANPVEIKIVDNQIMNFNNRSDFLEGIYNALNGLYYYINDFNSTGVLYYDVGDLYNIEVGENTYQCLMLNDEINVTTGIEEIIHTDMPQQSETDYTKADKTDMRINQTYRIVDKQNQKIVDVITNVTEQNNKISQITQTVDDLTSKIQDIADITTYGESDRAKVELINVNESEPIMIKVHPTSTNISYLYPRDNLYPSDNLFMPDRIIRFKRTYSDEGTTKTQNIDYELPDDLLRYSDTVYDEFYLNYESQTCQVTKRCGYNADGTVKALENEIITDYTYPTIILGEGNYEITLPGYDFAYIYSRLMAKNIYTTQFYTKVETDSKISQKANEINLGVNQRLTNYSTTNQMNSAINLKANEITSSVSQRYATKTDLNTAKSEIKQTTDSIISTVSNVNNKVDQNTSNITTNTQNISRISQTADNISLEVSKKVGNNEVISKINQSTEAVTINANKISLNGKTINLSSDNIAISSNNFSVDKTGKITAKSGTIGGYSIDQYALWNDNGNGSTGICSTSGQQYAFWAGAAKANSANAPFRVGHDGSLYASNATIVGNVSANNGNVGNFTLKDGWLIAEKNGLEVQLNVNGLNWSKKSGGTVYGLGSLQVSDSSTYIDFKRSDGRNSKIYIDELFANTVHAYEYNYDSLESLKKNINKYDKKALNIINNSNVYEYNYKVQDNNDKKTIGFVIGDEGNDYKTPKEILSKDGKSINSYSAIGVLWKAIQEQQAEIEMLKEKINKLEKGEK